MNLDSIRKINGTYNKTPRQSILDEMISDYNYANQNVITEFEVLINSDKALNVLVNSVPQKILMEYKNDKTVSESKFIIEIKSYIGSVKSGDVISYTDTEENYFLCTSKPMVERGYEVNYVISCNQFLKWKDINGNVYSEPCIVNKDSYGSKTLNNNDILTFSDSKAKILVQNNVNSRMIRPDYRFMMQDESGGSDLDIYKVINVLRSVNRGILELVAQKDFAITEDDIVNSIAYNNFSKDNVNREEKFKIKGEVDIYTDKEATFTIIPYGNNVKWEIDNENVAYISNEGDGECRVIGLIKEEVCTLIARMDNKIIARKSLEVV